MPTDKWNKKISQHLSGLHGQEDGVGYFWKKLGEMHVSVVINHGFT